MGEVSIVTGNENMPQCRTLQKIWEGLFPSKDESHLLCFLFTGGPMMSFHSTGRKAHLRDVLAAGIFLLLPPTPFLREGDLIEGCRQGPFRHLLGMSCCYEVSKILVSLQGTES